MNPRHRALVAACLVVLSPLAAAQTAYPAKPIRLVSPFPAGGTSDILARMIGKLLTDAWGQQVVVENRPGAGGTIGTEFVARAAPDGYTLVMGSITTHAINLSLYPKLPFDGQRDFAPVVPVAATQTLLAVHPSVPAKTVRDLVALAKARPKQLQYGSAGSGSISHMATELLKHLSGASINHVPYKGEGQAMLDVMSGQIDMLFANVPSIMGMVRAGRMRPVAVGGTARSSIFPDVPTVAESGVPGFEMSGWFGLFSPAGVPRDVQQKINAEVNRSLQRPEVREQLAGQGADPAPATVEQFTAYVQAEVVKWAKVIAASGTRL